MKPVAIERAREHLVLAREAAAVLTPDDGFKAYAEAWSQFLSQASRFYSKMEQGAKGCGKSEAWFGKKNANERQINSYPTYITHAMLTNMVWSGWRKRRQRVSTSI